MDLCNKHPRYKGKRKPKHACASCLTLYIALMKPRSKIPRPQPAMKDKSKYFRNKRIKDEG